MKEYNLKQSIIIIIAGSALLWMCLYCFVFPHLVGGGPESVPIVRSDEGALFMAMENYKQDFRSYPAGESSNVVRVLAGDNPQKTIYLNFRRSIEHPNEMVDPWATPYQITFLQQTNFIIRSAGKDKVFGNLDDIVFNSISNNFVKP